MTYLVHTLFFLNLVRCLTSLKLSMVGVEPRKMILGQNAKLQCEFDMEGADLYSLKWYKNGREFYRYMPRQEHPTTVFDVPGVIIDLQYSNIHQLHLTSVQLSTGGMYRCEVSTEAPDFDTISEQFKVEVISLPKGPQLTGLETTYSPGDLVKANCSAYDSMPAASLIWYINKTPVKEDSRYDRRVTYAYPGIPAVQPPVSRLQTYNSGNLTTSHLELSFTLKLSHFQDGKLNLKCTAFLDEIFMRSKEVAVEQIRQKTVLSQPSSQQESADSPSLDFSRDTGLFNQRTHSNAVKSPGGMGFGISSSSNLISQRLFLISWQLLAVAAFWRLH